MCRPWLRGETKPEAFWIVEDIAALEMSLSTNVKITHPLEERSFGQVFGVVDPAGETQYLVEFATERPSKHVK